MFRLSRKRILISLISFVIVYASLLYFTGNAFSNNETSNFQYPVCTNEKQCSLQESRSHSILKSAIANPDSFKDWVVAVMGFWLLGALLAFTPCVLPLMLMISGFFAGSYSIMSHRKVFAITLTYVLSIAVTYAIAGTIAAYFGIYVQAYLQNPWIIATFSLIVALLALSILASIDIRLPARLRHSVIKFNKLHDNYTYPEVAIMGVIATLIASPCIAAPLIAVLGYVGQSGSLLSGAILLFVVGLGIGTPLLVATMIGKQFVPHIGTWQIVLKNFFGLVLMGVAIYLISHVISYGWTMFLWSALIIFTANYMTTLYTQEGKFLLLWKSVTLMTLVYGLVLFFGSIAANNDTLNIFALSPSLPQTNYYAIEITDMSSLNEIMRASQNTHDPVMIFFKAKWCVACHELDTKLNDPQLYALVRQFTILTIDLSDPHSETYQVAKHFNVIGPPEIIFFSPTGREVANRIIGNVNSLDIKTTIIKVLLTP